MRAVDYAALIERRCSVCKIVKPVSEFNRYDDPTAVLTGWRYYSRCIDCNRSQCRDYGQRGKPQRNARLRAWRAANPEKAALLDRRKRLMKNYGLTVEQADELLAANGGRCLICDTAQAVAIDHCHTTGRVRGGVCNSCNTFLGRVEANPKILSCMAAYAGIGQPCHADVLLRVANEAS
jgi:hypothetical protein